MIFAIEIALIWAIYTFFAHIMVREPPIWLTSMLIILIDRSIAAISRWAEGLRARNA